MMSIDTDNLSHLVSGGPYFSGDIVALYDAPPGVGVDGAHCVGRRYASGLEVVDTR